jgi:hypothetical protein
MDANIIPVGVVSGIVLVRGISCALERCDK